MQVNVSFITRLTNEVLIHFSLFWNFRKLFKAAARIIILSINIIWISDLILVKKKNVKSHKYINISAAGFPQKRSVYKRSTV